MGKYILLTVLLVCGCTKKSDQAQLTPVEKGKRLYATHCTACHSPDPKLDGAVGPAVHGAPAELLESRILQGKYPAGYKPKRATHIMPVLPFLKNDIPALQAYLNSP